MHDIKESLGIITYLAEIYGFSGASAPLGRSWHDEKIPYARGSSPEQYQASAEKKLTRKVLDPSRVGPMGKKRYKKAIVAPNLHKEVQRAVHDIQTTIGNPDRPLVGPGAYKGKGPTTTLRSSQYTRSSQAGHDDQTGTSFRDMMRDPDADVEPTRKNQRSIALRSLAHAGHEAGHIRAAQHGEKPRRDRNWREILASERRANRNWQDRTGGQLTPELAYAYSTYVANRDPSMERGKNRLMSRIRNQAEKRGLTHTRELTIQHMVPFSTQKPKKPEGRRTLDQVIQSATPGNPLSNAGLKERLRDSLLTRKEKEIQSGLNPFHHPEILKGMSQPDKDALKKYLRDMEARIEKDLGPGSGAMSRRGLAHMMGRYRQLRKDKPGVSTDMYRPSDPSHELSLEKWSSGDETATRDQKPARVSDDPLNLHYKKMPPSGDLTPEEKALLDLIYRKRQNRIRQSADKKGISR